MASLETVMPLTVCHSIAMLWLVKCLNVDRFAVLLMDKISCSFDHVDRFTVLLTYEISCSFDLGKNCVFKHRFRASNTNFNYNCMERTSVVEMIITFMWFWADISYKTDHKFTRNTLERSSLLHKGPKLTHFSCTEYKLLPSHFCLVHRSYSLYFKKHYNAPIMQFYSVKFQMKESSWLLQ